MLSHCRKCLNLVCGWHLSQLLNRMEILPSSWQYLRSLLAICKVVSWIFTNTYLFKTIMCKTRPPEIWIPLVPDRPDSQSEKNKTTSLPLAFRRQHQYQLHRKTQHHPHNRSQLVNAQLSPQPANHLYLKANTSAVSPTTPTRSTWLHIHYSQLPPTSAQIQVCANFLFIGGEQILASTNPRVCLSPLLLVQFLVL